MFRMTLVADQHTISDCRLCQGHCCRYFALQIDTPTDPEDFDHVRWYLAHRQVAVFVEGDDWFLQVDNACRYLQPDHSCSIYAQRPQICRTYGADPSGENECHGMDKPCHHDEFFDSLESFDAYLSRRPAAPQNP
jgi:uncharacterized protein